jgi:hypothetical protein
VPKMIYMHRAISHSLKCIALAIFFSLGISSQNLHAQVVCTGSACDLLPTSIKSQLNASSSALETQYVDKVLESMTEAAVLSNINSAMMGPGLVNRFQVGAGISAAGQKKEDISVVYQDLNFNNLPNVGATITPNINIAFNLGWLLGYGPSDTPTENANYLHRFNVYIHGFQYNFANSDVQDLIKRQQDNLQLGGGITNYGAMIRFHVFPSYGDEYGVFEFSGISLGLGLHYQKQEMNVVYADSTAQTIALGSSAVGSWSGDTNFRFKSTVTSIPMDVRTGFRFFYFMTLFAGAGTSLNFGSTSLDFSREGPLGITATDTTTSTSISQSGTLSVALNGKASPPNSMGYVVGGLEFNLLFLKILVEGMASKNIQSANIGVKVAF